MKQTTKVSGKASSVSAGLTWAVIAELGIMFAGIGLAAVLIERGMMDWENIGYAVLIILLVSSWAGAAIAALKIKRRKLMFCLMSGVNYFAVLLGISALFFGGKYSGVGETAILIICGSLLASMWVSRGNKRIKHMKIRDWNR